MSFRISEVLQVTIDLPPAIETLPGVGTESRDASAYNKQEGRITRQYKAILGCRALSLLRSCIDILLGAPCQKTPRVTHSHPQVDLSGALLGNRRLHWRDGREGQPLVHLQVDPPPIPFCCVLSSDRQRPGESTGVGAALFNAPRHRQRTDIPPLDPHSSGPGPAQAR